MQIHRVGWVQQQQPFQRSNGGRGVAGLLRSERHEPVRDWRERVGGKEALGQAIDLRPGLSLRVNLHQALVKLGRGILDGRPVFQHGQFLVRLAKLTKGQAQHAVRGVAAALPGMQPDGALEQRDRLGEFFLLDEVRAGGVQRPDVVRVVLEPIDDGVLVDRVDLQRVGPGEVRLGCERLRLGRGKLRECLLQFIELGRVFLDGDVDEHPLAEILQDFADAFLAKILHQILHH